MHGKKHNRYFRS